MLCIDPERSTTRDLHDSEKMPQFGYVEEEGTETSNTLRLEPTSWEQDGEAEPVTTNNECPSIGEACKLRDKQTEQE